MRDSTGLPYPDGMDNNVWRNETNNDSGMRKDRADDNMQNNRGNDGMRMDRGNDMRWDDGMYDGGSMMGDNQQGRMPSDSTQDYGVRGGERFYDESAEISTNREHAPVTVSARMCSTAFRSEHTATRIMQTVCSIHFLWTASLHSSYMTMGCTRYR